jgi:hypothetical protein
MVAPHRGYMRRGDRVRLWLGVGATAVIALAALAVGVGFVVYAGSSSKLPGAAAVIGVVIVLYGLLVGLCAYRMSQLHKQAAETAFKALGLPALVALGAAWSAFEDGFHLGDFEAAAGLIAGLIVCAVLIAQAATVVQRFGR